MSRRRRQKRPTEPLELRLDGLSHDGRGVGSVGDKRIFVRGALPGERARVRVTACKRRYDEAEAVEILEPAADRVSPRCPHFGVCGGCSLQHLAPERQLAAKQESLLQNLLRIGKVEPGEVWEPLHGPVWGYRRKARLSVRYVSAKQRVLVGFREIYGRFVADMQVCHVLDSRVAKYLPELGQLLLGMQARESIPQIEVACGDDSCALVFRHLEPLLPQDLQSLRDFAERSGLGVLLQGGGPDTIEPLEPSVVELSYRLPDFGVELAFGPSDFVQVNAELNRAMVRRAVELLAPEPNDRVLDLFCGLGNFALPLATCSGEVVGVEGDTGLVAAAARNADRNGLGNARFHVADLAVDPGSAPWLKGGFQRVLIDPPRSGAEFILPQLAASGASRLVYVSCHPASLARDAAILVQRHGFELAGAGVMDMFPHTGHVESIALFDRSA